METAAAAAELYRQPPTAAAAARQPLPDVWNAACWSH